MEQVLYYRKVDPRDVTTSQGILFHWCRNAVAVLDVGCGCGHMGKALHDHKHCRCSGIEYDRSNRKVAEKLGVYEEIADTDLNHLTPQSLAAWRGKFDTVIMGDVLEHLLDARAALVGIKECLNPKGELLISIPNISHASIKAGLMLDQFRYSDIGLLDRSHLHFFTAENVAELMSNAGLEIVEATGTVLSVKGFTDGAAFARLDPAIRQYIFRDLHSYLCQYICRCVPSPRTPKELFGGNLRKLDFRFEDFPPELREYAERMLAESSPRSDASGYSFTSRTFEALVI